MKKLVMILILAVTVLLSSCNGEEQVHVRLNPGIDTVEIGDNWIDTGAHLSVGELFFNAYTEDTVDTSVLGETEVNYTLTYEDQEYTITRMIMVIDETPPELSLLPGIDSLMVDDVWVDGGCTVTDNSGETLTCGTDSIVDTSTAGEYEVEYTAEDSSGNVGTITRIVTIDE